VAGPDPTTTIARRRRYGKRAGILIAVATATGYIVAGRAMTVRALLVGLCLMFVSVPAVWADARGDAKKQVEFGIQVAQRGLWREATYRWERATQLDPSYAAAFNNLAVAYEHEGQLAKARAAYDKALALEPNNALVRQNFDLFKEINDRVAQKDGRQP